MTRVKERFNETRTHLRPESLMRETRHWQKVGVKHDSSVNRQKKIGETDLAKGSKGSSIEPIKAEKPSVVKAEQIYKMSNEIET